MLSKKTAWLCVLRKEAINFPLTILYLMERRVIKLFYGNTNMIIFRRNK